MKLLAAILLSSTAIWSGTIRVTDPFNATGNSDVIGNKLQLDGESVRGTYDDTTLTLYIRTNYDNPRLYSFRDTGLRLDIGDIFFTVNGEYRYGIPLHYHNGPSGGPWGGRLLAGHIYEIESPGALMTARQVLHDPMYVDYRPDEIVWMMARGGVEDLTSGTPSVAVTRLDGNDGANGPLYEILVRTTRPPELFSSPTDQYALHWAVATNGNDILQGPVGTPEPGTFFLAIGAVLIVVARLMRRHRTDA